MLKYNCDAWGNHKVLDSYGTDISFVGALISFGTGLLNMTESIGKIFDAAWAPTIGVEIVWRYDMINNDIEKKNQGLKDSY